MFSLERPQLNELEMNDLRVSRIRFNAESNKLAKFDLNLGVSETERGLAAVVTYKRELFKESTIEELIKNLQLVLESMTADLEQRIEEMTLPGRATGRDWAPSEGPGSMTSVVFETVGDL
jgi:non-ribosomal peptide synthetase component F